MKTLALKFLIAAGAVYLMAEYIPGITVEGTYTIFIVALVWSLITMFVRPILRILTFPITFLTLGLFSFVLNAILFAIMAYFVPGFSLSGIIPAFIGSIILSFATSLAEHRL